jgi:hypothetical protein
MEKILKIEEKTFSKDVNGWNKFDGYEITTDSQVIKIGIDNGQCCCEDWGYLITNDNINEFIDSNLISISIVDSLLDKKNIELVERLKDYECSAMFVNFETNIGLLQFVAYNSHNGYYSHEAVLISKELNVSENL